MTSRNDPMRRRLLPSFLLLVAMVIATAPAALAVSTVVITSPPAEQPVFGVVNLAAEVEMNTPVKQVEFFVDGVSVGAVDRSPYLLPFDIGQANISHHIRAVAHDAFGGATESTISTASIPVNMEVDVELMQLFVSVTDSHGEQVTDLDEEEFEVRNNRGRREQLATFGGGDLPISAVVLVDSSESMEGRRLEAAIEGAKAFAAHTREGDETMVALFSDRLLRATTFTSSPEMLDRTLDGVTAAGGTAVNDHIYYALNRLETRLGRRVIVLLSDGYDISSVLDMSQVQWRARRSQAMIYWIRLEDQGESGLDTARFNSNWREADDNERQFDLIEQSVGESGGRIISIERLAELQGAFHAIVDELREQYVLGYHPKDRQHDGRWRPIKVRTTRFGLDVRARAGYID